MGLFKKKDSDKHRKHSYSQTGEDCIVDFIFKHLQIEKPSYLDIGAHHPYFLSNTAAFYEKGCRGINIEPDPKLFKNFITHRPLDINLNIGISDKEGLLDFYILTQPELNTFSKEEAERYQNSANHKVKQVLQIKVNTISHVLETHFNNKFPDFLSVDVEGIDELILRSINFEHTSPIVICVETIGFSKEGVGFKQNSILEFLQSKGYFIFADTSINTIFVKQDKWK